MKLLGREMKIVRRSKIEYVLKLKIIARFLEELNTYTLNIIRMEHPFFYLLKNFEISISCIK